MASKLDDGLKGTTRADVPPNPAADRSLIINGRGFRLWDNERDCWATPILIAKTAGSYLLGLNERVGATVEIREAQ